MAKMKKDIKSRFKHIRETFFPRWDQAHKWKIEISSYSQLCGAQGSCEPETKTIFIARGWARDLCVVIHEICHAVTYPWHGKRWQQRMQQAAAKAHILGRDKLAERILEHVEKYRDRQRAWASEFYDEIENYVSELPHLTFQEVVNCVSRDFKLSPEEFLHRLRRAEKVYSKVQKRIRQPRNISTET
jgi:hypothetical protein